LQLNEAAPGGLAALLPYFGDAMKSFLASVALLAIRVSIKARAADMPVKAPPIIPSPPYNWSGFYLGANLGGAWSSGSLNIPGNNLYGGLTEFIGGVQLGYNVQLGHFLLASRAISMGRLLVIPQFRLLRSAR
jgi:opacity protein-like surface antigen